MPYGTAGLPDVRPALSAYATNFAAGRASNEALRDQLDASPTGEAKMTIPRAMTLTAAVGAALLLAGAAEAGSKKRSRAVAAPAATAPVCSQAPGSMGPGVGMAGHGPGAGPMGGGSLPDRFDEIDVDKSGQLSRDEVKAWSAARQQEMRRRVEDHIKAADANGDGQISLDEAKAKLPMAYDHFEFLDANKDGQISMAEFERLRDPGAMRAEVLARLKAADNDNDGKLNLAEVQVAFPAVAPRFSQLDKDNDGFLTAVDFAFLVGPH
jgi:Ca2+-binding EF-hand superfamily protein